MQKSLGLLLALFALGLAACSGGNVSSANPFTVAGVVISTPSPSPVPTAPPTAAANAVNVVVNPSFELGSSVSSTFLVGTLTNPTPVGAVIPAGWSVCQNMSEDQPTAGAVSPNTFVQLVTSSSLSAIVPSGAGLTQAFNAAPNTLAGTNDTAALMLGNVNASGTLAGRTKGGFGLCQQVVVPTNGLLTFWVNEGSGGTASTTTSTSEFIGVPVPGPTASSFGEGSDQEAAILMPSTAANPFTVVMPLFNELDLSQNDPAPYATASNTALGFQSGYVKKGPYNLSALAGQTVELYFGIYSSTAATTSFTFMLVDDVSLSGIPAQPAAVNRTSSTNGRTSITTK
jgi:hypothetical protein